jgi:hypothetical protein
MRRQRLSGGQCCQFCPAVWKRSLQQFGSRQILLRCPRIPGVGVPAHGKILHRWATLDNSQYRWGTELRIVTGRRNAAWPSGRGFSYEALIRLEAGDGPKHCWSVRSSHKCAPIQVNCGSTGNRTCVRHPQPDASSVAILATLRGAPPVLQGRWRQGIEGARRVVTGPRERAELLARSRRFEEHRDRLVANARQ